MSDLSPGGNTASLGKLYGECIQAFGRFLLALGEEDCRVIRLEQVRISPILEEYGRAKIWGDQTRADLPARARGSLDDVLRHDDDLQQLVRGVFVRLAALLSQATSIAEKKYDPQAGSDYDSVSSVSADSSSDLDDDYNSESSRGSYQPEEPADPEGGHQRRSMPKIRLLVQQITGQILSLYDLSALLRRPKVADKYIRSVDSKNNGFEPSNSDTLPLSVGFCITDENHVIEKVLQWRGLMKSGRSVGFEEEAVAPIREQLTHDGVEDVLWLCRRLARANTRRREQLQYWTAHPFNRKKDMPSDNEPPAHDLEKFPVKQSEEVQESRSQVSTLKPADGVLPHRGPRSKASKRSFSTAPVSLVHDTKTNVRPRTVYTPTAIGKGRSNSVPYPPKVKDDAAVFSCPFCGTTLENSEMQDRQSWQRHVFRDLRPYVCTFEDCQNAGKLYLSRHDWIYHELQVHRREYVCNQCDTRCQTRPEALAHFTTHYRESVPPARLNIMLDLSERQVDVSVSEKEECLVCGEELSLFALQGHLASHMEDLALFVLPNIDEDEEAGDSNASVQVMRRDKASDGESEASSLGFSVSGNNEQDSLEFSKNLAKEEEGYSNKVSFWETDHGAGLSATSASPANSEEDYIPYTSRVPPNDTDGDADIVVDDADMASNADSTRAHTGRSRPTSPAASSDEFPPSLHLRQRRMRRERIARANEAIAGRARTEEVDRRPSSAPPTSRSGVSYAAWMAAVRGPDDEIAHNIRGYLFPVDFKHNYCFAVKGLVKPRVRATPEPDILHEGPSENCFIGRSKECDIVLPSTAVSSIHCSITFEEGESHSTPIITDHSSSGTYVNGERAGRRLELHDDDIIAITPDLKFIFKVPERQPTRVFGDLFMITREVELTSITGPSFILGQTSTTHTFGLQEYQERYMEVQRQHIRELTVDRRARVTMEMATLDAPARRGRLSRCVNKSTGHGYAVRKITKSADAQTTGGELAWLSSEKEEISLLMRARHSSILRLLDTFVDASEVHLVFDVEPERYLTEVVFEKSSLTQPEARWVLTQVLNGVEYLHDRNIVLNDIRPDNVAILDKTLSARLTDFRWAGTAKAEPARMNVASSLKHTKSHDVCLLGVMLYFCLYGYEHYTSTKEIADKPSSIRPKIDPSLRSLSSLWKGREPIIGLILLMLNGDTGQVSIKECMAHPWMSAVDSVD